MANLTAAQSIHGPWVSTDGLCIEFDSLSNLVLLAPDDYYGDWRRGRQRFQYKSKNGRLTIKHFHHRALLWMEPTTSKFTIDRLTEDELVLTMIEDRGGTVAELMGTPTVVFKRLNIGCLKLSPYYQP
jgi:hypothetical protein